MRNFSKSKAVVLSLALSAVMGTTMFTSTAIAAEGGNLDVSIGDVEITAEEEDCPGHTITGTSTTNKILVKEGIHNIILEDVNVDVSAIRETCAFEIARGATVNLTLNGSNFLSSGSNKAGLSTTDATLSLEGNGSLTVTAKSGAGIGSNRDGMSCGSITIGDHVTVIANGGSYDAGIGNGYRSGGGLLGSIRIKDEANVTATGGLGSAGIGRGHDSGAIIIIAIEGGTVIAKGGDRVIDATDSLGIGISTGGSSPIIISGNKTIVKATGGAEGKAMSNEPTLDGNFIVSPIGETWESINTEVTWMTETADSEPKSSDRYMKYNYETIDAIRAAKGDNLTINAGEWVSFCKKVYEELALKPSLSLTVNYKFEDKNYTLTIPAGADLSEFLKSDHSGYRFVDSIFPGTEVK